MKLKPFALLPLFLALALLLAACGSGEAAPTVTSSPSATPDPCSSEYLPAAVQGVHSVMRAFDDASALASNTPREGLLPAITELQRIRREAEDRRVPTCLSALKQAQLTHMNTVIQTLMAFLGGADQATMQQGIALARQQHDLYIIEIARVLGMTVVAPASATPGAGIPAPTLEGLGSAPTEAETVTPSVAMATNPGPATVNMRASPALDGQNLGLLAVGQSALALSQSADGDWLLVELPGQPGQTAWVFAALVQVSGPGPLPVATSMP